MTHPMTLIAAFKSLEGEVAYLSVYDAAMKMWPVPYDEMEVSSRFGETHVVASGPRTAPPLVLLHGYWATLTMWAPNISEFSKGHRVYAIDVMGQPGRSIPGEPIRNAADHVAWLAAVLDALHLDRVCLAGMSFGGWLALNYAVAAPERVQALVLLSPAASVFALVKQFALRGALMMLLPTRFTVNAFMRWLGFKDDPDDFIDRDRMSRAIDLMYLGLKHFRFPRETSRIAPTVFSDAQLRAMQVPTLLLMGEDEVIYDPAKAMSRARRLIPDLEGELVVGCSHEMTVSQHRIVDGRVVDFLNRHESQHSRSSPNTGAAPASSSANPNKRAHIDRRRGSIDDLQQGPQGDTGQQQDEEDPSDDGGGLSPLAHQARIRDADRDGGHRDQAMQRQPMGETQVGQHVGNSLRIKSMASL